MFSNVVCISQCDSFSSCNAVCTLVHGDVFGSLSDSVICVAESTLRRTSHATKIIVTTNSSDIRFMWQQSSSYYHQRNPLMYSDHGPIPIVTIATTITNTQPRQIRTRPRNHHPYHQHSPLPPPITTSIQNSPTPPPCPSSAKADTASS
jgi:hypothetical protein